MTMAKAFRKVLGFVLLLPCLLGGDGALATPNCVPDEEEPLAEYCPEEDVRIEVGWFEKVECQCWLAYDPAVLGPPLANQKSPHCPMAEATGWTTSGCQANCVAYYFAVPGALYDEDGVPRSQGAKFCLQDYKNGELYMHHSGSGGGGRGWGGGWGAPVPVNRVPF